MSDLVMSRRAILEYAAPGAAALAAAGVPAATSAGAAPTKEGAISSGMIAAWVRLRPEAGAAVRLAYLDAGGRLVRELPESSSLRARRPPRRPPRSGARRNRPARSRRGLPPRRSRGPGASGCGNARSGPVASRTPRPGAQCRIASGSTSYRLRRRRRLNAKRRPGLRLTPSSRPMRCRRACGPLPAPSSPRRGAAERPSTHSAGRKASGASSLQPPPASPTCSKRRSCERATRRCSSDWRQAARAVSARPFCRPRLARIAFRRNRR